MSHIKLEQLTKRFGQLTALNDINLEIGDQEFVVMLGPTGAGKTTTLRCVAGLETLDGGSVSFDGRDVSAVSPSERDVAFVFQNYALYPRKTVAENIAFPLLARNMGEAEIRRKTDEVTKMLNINHLLDRMPGQLSGGEMQRVALSRALVRDPNVFCMDEPLTNLDFKLRAQMRSELKRIQQELKATFFYVTNDQIEALSMGDTVAVLNHGVIQQIGPPQEVYDNPVNLFVATFIGNTRMNLLPCAFDADGKSISGKIGDWQISLQNGKLDALGKTTHRDQLLFGIRPEDLTLQAADQAGFKGQINVAEPLGDRIIYDVNLAGGEAIKIKAPPTTRFEMGENVTVKINAVRGHIFDAESEGAIC